MSKSRGNLVLVSKLRADGIDPAAIRLGLLAGHYRDRPVVESTASSTRRRRGWHAGAQRRRSARRARTRRTWSPGCAGTWPTILIPRKPLPHLMVGPPMRSTTAATTPGPGAWCAAVCRRVVGLSSDLPETRGWSSFRAMGSVNGKVVFITGGANGIGAEVARRLHDKGAKLVLTDLDEAAAQDVATDLGEDRVLTATADVRDLAAMAGGRRARAIERFGGIDVVIANAGIATSGSVLAGRSAGLQDADRRQRRGRVPHRAGRAAVGHRASRLRADRVVGCGLCARRPGWCPTTRRRPGSSISRTRFGWRSLTAASMSGPRTCRGSTRRWSARARPIRRPCGRCCAGCRGRWARPLRSRSAVRRSSRASRAANVRSTARVGSACCAG